MVRKCEKPRCTASAVATLTYDYGEATAVIGPLSSKPSHRGYDMCSTHASRFTAPQGWQIVRLVNNFVDVTPSDEEFAALSEAVRDAAMRVEAITRSRPQKTSSATESRQSKISSGTVENPRTAGSSTQPGRRRGYFRVIDGEGS